MLRREFVRLLAKITGGTMAATLAPPLLRINTALLSETQAQCVNPMTCGQQDCCTTQDNCGATDTTGHTCATKDLCDIDASGNCTNDECQEDRSLACRSDKCVIDKSGTCTSDTCDEDLSGDCVKDSCTTDKSGACISDSCITDKSGSCTNDQCETDESETCQSDSCIMDKSGSCKNDQCNVDMSGTCTNDQCQEDSSGTCTSDYCVTDKSGSCVKDYCISDFSGDCVKDVCVLDASSSCKNDICREDRTPIICQTDVSCTNDICSLDLALNPINGRREFARAGLNQAIKWLYRLSVILFTFALAQNAVHAATVIDSRNAVLSPTPTYTTGQAVSVPNPVGPFLRDCDGDGILEADTNGDGQCQGDPKIIVMDNTGGVTWGLPAGTAFSGSFEFTCFHIPYRMALVSTGPLTIKASREVAIFGAMRLSGGDTVFSTPASIDLRTSAWLSDGGITFITAQAGEVDETQTTYDVDSHVPPIFYDSLCGRLDWGLFLPLILRGN
jgi:hypothetical protein